MNIAGESYVFNVNPDREDVYRYAAKVVNKSVATLQKDFKGVHSRESALAITALDLAIKMREMEKSRSIDGDMDDIVELDRKLDDYLSKL